MTHKQLDQQSLRTNLYCSRSEYLSVAALALAAVAGLVFRLKMFWMERSLWLDSAMLALNLVEKSPIQLLGPLDWNQAAPGGFLLLSKGIGALFDYSELSLTFLPLFFSVISLLGFLWLSVDVLDLAWAPIAFVPFATCSTAVYYAGEFKQYSADLAVTVILLALAVRIFDAPRERLWLACWTMTAVLGAWLSHTTILIAASTGAMLLVNARMQDRKFRSVLLSVLVVAAHFVALYWFQIRKTASEDILHLYQNSFAPLPVSRESVQWWVDLVSGYTEYPLGFEGSVYLPLAMIGLGLCTWFVGGRNRVVVSILGLPLLTLVFASYLGNYPMVSGNHDIHSRFLLFTVPISALLLGIGARSLGVVAARWFPMPSRCTAGVLGLLAALALSQPSIWRIGAWPEFLQQEMRPLVTELRAEFETGDLVYVYYAAIPAFRFYTRNEPIPFIPGSPNQELGADMKQKLAGISHHRRVWVVVSHDYSGVEAQISRLLSKYQRRIHRHAFPGAVLLRADPALHAGYQVR